jgi:hypothetical protein
MGVYMNWWRLDPWFTIRMIFHGYHPNSPLSHPILTKRVFFSDGIPEPYLISFQKQSSHYESYLWPFSMMTSFANPRRLVQNISGWGNGQRILVMSGAGDKIMTIPIMQALAEYYRKAVNQLVGEKKIGPDQATTIESLPSGELDTAGQGVRNCIVPIGGHHLQNDVTWEIGAKKLLEFYEQL